jgi:RNA polymerase sigma-70 factor (ECF subfamily)
VSRYDAGDLYRELAPAVLGYLRSQRLPDPENVLGEVFLQVARDIQTFDGDEAAVRRWVFTVTHNRIIDDVRRRSRRPQISDHAVPERASPPPEEPIDETLVAALAHLTPEQREVIALRFIADLPLEAVAAVTGRRVGAVKAMQHRALAALARLLEAEQQGSDAERGQVPRQGGH